MSALSGQGRLYRACSGKTDLICELMPKRSCSSGAKYWGAMVADRSFCIPVCFPRRNEAIVMRAVPGWRGNSCGDVKV